MARKFCPNCNRLNGGTATECSQCGHVFDAASMVESKPSRRCLLCGASNPHNAQRCRCGEDLDINLDEVRVRLRSQRTNGAIVAGVAIVVLAGMVVWLFAGQSLWVWLFLLPPLAASYGLRGVILASQRLSALPAGLPKATLRDPRD